MNVASQPSMPRAARANGAPAPLPFAAVDLTLDDLLALPPRELEVLYKNGRTPELASISGDLRGRMLALAGSPAVLLGPLGRVLARQGWFPWRGKSFTPPKAGGGYGAGINRIFTDSVRWYRFETFVGRSRAGDFDAVQLDYDNRDNPWFIRVVKDEIREIKPGLFLGQAYLGSTLALYFGLE